MSLFQSRAPRLDLSFPLQFCDGGATIKGHCLNLSETGLLGAFDEALELWTSGELELSLGPHTLKLPARVARINDNEAGLAFSFRGEADREGVRRILAYAAVQTGVVSRPPF